MKVPILSGVYTDIAGDVRAAYPRNFTVVSLESGINSGHLRPAPGIVEMATVPEGGPDRGAVEWNGAHYRVSGGKFVRVDPNGSILVLGDLPGTERVGFAVGFDQLAISAGGKLFYFYGSGAPAEVVDGDLGTVLDVAWQGGYFITTDGEFLVVTDLNDPAAVNPLKYGSAESDPDPLRGVSVVRNELYAFGRYSVEVYQNSGGENFPFSRIGGAQVTRGAVGPRCVAEIGETWAFLGSAREEPVSVWAIDGGSSQRLATREIERILMTYSEETLRQSASMESRQYAGQEMLYLHLPDRTFVYDLAASVAQKQPVWTELATTIDAFAPAAFAARGVLWVHGRWWWGHYADARIGCENESISSHWGERVGWAVSTVVLYNNGFGAIVHDLELVALQGRAVPGDQASVWNSYSNDGSEWSIERPVRAALTGQTARRLAWRGQGRFQHWRVQRFRGTSDSHTTLLRLEMRVEPLNG